MSAPLTTNHSCSITGSRFTISESESRLLEHFGLPLPERSAFERWLYAVGQSTPFVFRKVVCPATNQPILSRWSESGKIRGVSPEWFWSDECDNTSVGQDFDFTRPFFEQFCEVAANSYAPSMTRYSCENSPYVNASHGLKDCHLCFACASLQDSLYCVLCTQSKDLLFCSGVTHSELSYWCLDSTRLYGCRYVQDSEGCTNCYFSTDCIGCSNCFQCHGLRQASNGYYVRNQSVTREVWEQTLQEAQFGSYAAEQFTRDEAARFFADLPSYPHSFGNEECSEIYRVSNSKTTHHAMYCRNCHDCSGVIFSSNCKDCHSTVWGRDCEGCYYVIGADRAFDCMYCDGLAGGGRNQAYCFCCSNGCTDVFGCFFLKKKSYCILNKQYTPQAYAELRPKIIDHMRSTGECGAWFPPEFYSVPYNQSWAQFFLAELDEQQILARGLGVAAAEPFRATTSSVELPDHIEQTDEAICGKELACLKTSRPYSLSKQELAALKKHLAPVPRLHWSEALTQMQRQGTDRARIALRVGL